MIGSLFKLVLSDYLSQNNGTRSFGVGVFFYLIDINFNLEINKWEQRRSIYLLLNLTFRVHGMTLDLSVFGQASAVFGTHLWMEFGKADVPES